jgi:chromosome segregation ATPase
VPVVFCTTENVRVTADVMHVCRSWEEERASLQAHINQLKKESRSLPSRGGRTREERASASETFSEADSGAEMELADLQMQLEEARDKEVGASPGRHIQTQPHSWRCWGCCV